MSTPLTITLPTAIPTRVTQIIETTTKQLSVEWILADITNDRVVAKIQPLNIEIEITGTQYDDLRGDMETILQDAILSAVQSRLS